MDRRLIDSFESKFKSAFRNFKFAILAGAMLFALCSLAQAQPAKIYRIGYLNSSSFSGNAHLLEAFRKRLRELEWVEGKNIGFEYRFADGKGAERLKELAAELVRRKVDVIVARATSGSMAAKEATSTIPIVMTGGGDPVGGGIVKSLARPGGISPGSAPYPLN
jgi:putative tryptophan/tyrosine transport system substrate-binding protein